MDVLSNTNVYGELRSIKIRQSFSNRPNIDYSYFVPVVKSFTISFAIGSKDYVIPSFTFKKSDLPLIQAFDIDSGKQVSLDCSFELLYGEDVGQYKVSRSDPSTEQNLLITLVGIMADDPDGPQI